jgi:hypothetical protein
MVGMPGPWRPKFQLRSSVSAGCKAALPRKSDPGGAASLPWQTIARLRGVMGEGRLDGGAVQSWVMRDDDPPTDAQRRESIDEVAARVSFTVGTTVLPSFGRHEPRRHLKLKTYKLKTYPFYSPAPYFVLRRGLVADLRSMVVLPSRMFPEKVMTFFPRETPLWLAISSMAALIISP